MRNRTDRRALDRIVRPTWIDIDLSAVRSNFELAQRSVRSTVMAVVKANAYGHGAIQVARALEQAGAPMLGVALVEEGVELRNAGIRTPILVLSGSYEVGYDLLVQYNLIPAVFRSEHIVALSTVGRTLQSTIPVHLKVDTGLNRIGASLEELPALLKLIRASPFIELDGLFSHLSNADGDDEQDSRAVTQVQQDRFRLAAAMVKNSGSAPRWRHLVNSAGMLSLRDVEDMNMVRVGIFLYGCPPMTWMSEEERKQLRPVLSWHSRVIHLKSIVAGESVSYGSTWTAARPTRIATIPVGYADGLSRQYSSKAHFLVNGCRVPVVGRVCMDMCMLDVTDVPSVALQDLVTIIGSQGDHRITASDLARLEGTIERELLCRISPRVPRVTAG